MLKLSEGNQEANLGFKCLIVSIKLHITQYLDRMHLILGHFHKSGQLSIRIAGNREALFLLRISTILPLLSSWGVRPALFSGAVKQPSVNAPIALYFTFSYYYASARQAFGEKQP